MRNGPSPWRYLLGVTAWTWAFWGGAVLTGRPWLALPTLALYVLGALGPLVVSLWLVHRGYWDAPLAAFLHFAFHPRRLPLRWYAYILGLVLVRAGLPVALSVLFLEGQLSDRLVLGAPGAFLLVGALAGAVEEPGWRGYAQEALQRRMPVLAASLVTGLFWAAWHLPLFAIVGTYQHGLGLGSLAFWQFSLAILLISPLYGWLYNAAERVALSAVIYHALANVAVELFSVQGAGWLEILTEGTLSLVIVIAAWRLMRAKRER